MITLQFEIRFENGKREARTLQLKEGDPLLIGRQNADLTISDVQISRKHAEIIVLNSSVIVRDLESHNGLLFNGSKVSTIELKEQLEFQLGHTVVQVLSIDGLEDLEETKSVIVSSNSGEEPLLDDKTDKLNLVETSDSLDDTDPIIEKKALVDTGPTTQPSFQKKENTDAILDLDTKSVHQLDKKLSQKQHHIPEWLKPLKDTSKTFKNYLNFLKQIYFNRDQFVEMVYLDGSYKESLAWLLTLSLIGFLAQLVKISLEVLGSHDFDIYAIYVATSFAISLGTVLYTVLFAWTLSRFNTFMESKFKFHQVLRFEVYLSLLILPGTLLSPFLPILPGIYQVIASIWALLIFFKIFEPHLGKFMLVAVLFWLTGAIVLSGVSGASYHALVAIQKDKSQKIESEAQNRISDLKKKLNQTQSFATQSKIPFRDGESYTYDIVVSSSSGSKSGEFTITISRVFPERVTTVIIGTIERTPFNYEFDFKYSQLSKLSISLVDPSSKFEPIDLYKVLILTQIDHQTAKNKEATKVVEIGGRQVQLFTPSTQMSQLGVVQYGQREGLHFPVILQGVLQAKYVSFSVQLRERLE